MAKTEEEKQMLMEKTEEEKLMDQYKELLETLPKESTSIGTPLLQYRGFWCPFVAFKGMLFFQEQFKAKDTDILLVSPPKSGTTWLKALAFAIVNRNQYSPKENNHPLFTSTPHQLVPFFEFGVWKENQFPNLDDLPKPRLFATHTPFHALPCSVKNSGAKFVYICRNPLDMFISLRQFLISIPSRQEEPITVEDDFHKFCEGIHGFGPFWEHMLGYWKASLEKPDKVLFLQYEDVKEDSAIYIKKLANFLGFPFSEEEEKQGLIDDISRLCSFESLREIQVNKSTSEKIVDGGATSSSFFRKGKVGDWVNYLTPQMVEKMEKIMAEKFGDSGLSFDLAGKKGFSIDGERA